jgi:hypothetical protein
MYENKIRETIRKLLLEAVIDDLISKSKRDEDEWKQLEEQLTNIGIQKNSSEIGNYLKWIFKHVSEKTDEPLSHVSGLIIDFNELKKKSSKWKNDKNESLSKDIFSFDRNQLEIAIQSVHRHDIDKYTINQSQNNSFICKIGKWNIYLPTNIQESREVASKGSIVTWCTARRNNNLFYSYALKNIFLFYILNDEDFTEKYCIGVDKYGVIEGKDYSETVNKLNKGFKDNYQTHVFGNDVKQKIHEKILNVASKFNYIHPSREIPLKAMGNLKTWKQMIRSWSKENRKSFLEYFFHENYDKYEHNTLSINVYNHILDNLHYYGVNHKKSYDFLMIFKIIKLKFKDHEYFQNNVLSSLSSLDNWRDFINRHREFERAVIISQLFDYVDNSSVKISEHPELYNILGDIAIDNPNWYFSEKTSDINSILNNCIDAYFNIFKLEEKSELNIFYRAANDISDWNKLIKSTPELVINYIITHKDFITVVNSGSIDPDVLKDIIDNKSSFNQGNTNSKIYRNYRKLYIEKYLMPNIKDTKYRQTILQDYKIWKKEIIENELPAGVVKDLFNQILLDSDISEIRKFDHNIIVELMEIIKTDINENYVTEVNKSWFEPQMMARYFYKYLIIKNNGLDIELFKNLLQTIGALEFIDKVFNDSDRSLMGTGLIKKEIYEYIVDNFKKIYYITPEDGESDDIDAEHNDEFDDDEIEDYEEDETQIKFEFELALERLSSLEKYFKHEPYYNINKKFIKNIEKLRVEVYEIFERKLAYDW